MTATRRLLTKGDAMEAILLRYRQGDDAPAHVHTHEQCGYVVSGTFRLTIDKRSSVLEAGSGYVVPAGATHTFDVIEPGEVVIVASTAQQTELGDTR